jgi:hypothetical protein
MSRFGLGYRDPQQPNETFGQYQERSENCYRDLVDHNDDEGNDDDDSNS